MEIQRATAQQHRQLGVDSQRLSDLSLVGQAWITGEGARKTPSPTLSGSPAVIVAFARRCLPATRIATI
jgi:hypothetical protein